MTEMQFTPSAWSQGGNRIDRRSDILKKYIDFTSHESQKARDEVSFQLNISYGSNQSQKYDLYGDNLPEDSPIFIFVHGGFWIEGSRDNSAWFVRNLYNSGISSATVGYSLAPTVNLDEMVNDIRLAIGAIHQQTGRRMWVCGHSAGSHLVAAALAIGEDDSFEVEGFFGVSGIYDLEHLIGTSMAEDANFDRETLMRNSVINETAAKRLKKRCKKGVVLAVGELESPQGFILQTKRFAEILRQAEVNVKEMIVPNEEHFSVIQKLSESDFILSQELIGRLLTNE